MSTARDAPRRMEPPVGEASGPFWEATRDRVFMLQWCSSCERPVFYPRPVCPLCLGDDLEWREASGAGEVYAVSVQHRPAMPLPAFQDGPYAVALVELAEGPRLMSNVVGCDPDDVEVGMPVKLTWEALSDGRNLPLFEPVDKTVKGSLAPGLKDA